MSLLATASQTVGPYFSLGFSALYRAELGDCGAAQLRCGISGRVLDGDGAAIPDAVLELWQADGSGHYPHPEDPGAGAVARDFQGFGRAPTDALGRFAFSTTRPGPVAGPDGSVQAPHVNVQVFMRGLLLPAATRMYFPDEPALARDPVLALVPEARRHTLIARRQTDGTLSWDVHMQGALETVFFTY